jgi:hypothetical protein
MNPQLIKLAKQTLNEKRSFQPPQPPQGQDPSQGGGAPPPGGMPGGDPSMGGGQPPPMDPSMGGGAGGPMPGAGGLTADSIRQIMQEVLSQMQMNQGGGAGGPGGGGAGKPGKPDLLAMSMDIFQIKKMMSTMFNTMGIPMPQEILDGPNRHTATGAPMPPGAAGSTSDLSQQAGQGGGGQPQGGGAQPQSSIQPIGAMQGAFPAGKSGSQKIGSPIDLASTATKDAPLDIKPELQNKASALSAIIKRNAKNGR